MKEEKTPEIDQAIQKQIFVIVQLLNQDDLNTYNKKMNYLENTIRPHEKFSDQAVDIVKAELTLAN